MPKKRSKNNPDARRKQKKVVRTCQFCGNTESVQRIQYGNKFRWACKSDNCVRFK